MALACKNQIGGKKTDFCIAQNKAKDASKSSQLLLGTRQKEAPQSRAWTYFFEVRVVMERLQCMYLLLEDMGLW